MPDSHLNILEKIWKRLNVSRVSRMNKHYCAIKNEIYPSTPKEKTEFEYFKKKFEEYYRGSTWFLRARIFLSMFLYASLVINVLKAIPLLSFLVEFIQLGSALLSTTVLLVILFWLTSKISMHIELMNESLTHIIAMYHQSGRRDSEHTLKKISKAF